MRKVLFLLLISFALVTEAPAQQQDRMRAVVEYLASQELGGRYPATSGDTLASEFLSGELRRLRLKPVVRDRGRRGFYQDFSYGKEEKRSTHNILAVLPGRDRQLRDEYLVIGAHYDHLGMGGQGSGSRRPDTLGVHPGADDNASGDAVLLQLARHFKKHRPRRSLIFAFFGAEEQGIAGSKSFVEWMRQEDARRIHLPATLDGIVAMINLDMVGRLRDSSLSVAGTGTSSAFQALAEQAAALNGLNISCTADGYGPSDHASFVAAEIPVLYLTSGGHMEYHTPGDIPSTLNYDGMQQVLSFAQALVARIDGMRERPDFIHVPGSSRMSHAAFKVTLGLMPDVTGASSVPGLRADIVVAGKPAHTAGLRSGDIIQEIDGKPVRDIQEYMTRLSELTAGSTIPVKVLRGEEVLVFQVQLNPSEK